MKTKPSFAGAPAAPATRLEDRGTTRLAAAALALAASMNAWAAPARAADPADLKQLQETRICIGCDLRGADLFGADLSRAVLSGADLTGADMTAAVLYFAVVQGADLTGVVLDGADLYGADLHRSGMDGASIQGARICHTVLPSGQRSYDQCDGFTGGF